MKESFWSYFVIVFGLAIVIIMLFINRMTSTTEEDYYLAREIMNSAMVDAVDYGTYRSTGRLVMSKEKFMEVFLRRFAESVTNNKTYQVSFYDIYEEPPKATIRIRTTAGVSLDSESFDVTLDTVQSGILETIYGIGKKVVENNEQTYNINFDKNCVGANGGQSTPVSVLYGGSLPEISKTAPTCGNKIFIGWSDSSNYNSGELYYNSNGVAVKSNYNLKSDITLYGRWSEDIKYTITFDRNCSGATGGQSTPVSVSFGGSLPEINKAAPTCDGYIFSGWSDNSNYNKGEIYYDSKGNASKSTFNLKSDITLYGRWVKKGKTYYCDDGTHVLSGTTCQYSPSYVYKCSTNAKVQTSNGAVGCSTSCASGYTADDSMCVKKYYCDGKESDSAFCTKNAKVSTVYSYPGCRTACASGYVEYSNTCSQTYLKTEYMCYHENQLGHIIYDYYWEELSSSRVAASKCNPYNQGCTYEGNRKVTCTNPQWTGIKTCIKTSYSCDVGELKDKKCVYPASTKVTGTRMCKKTSYTCDGIGGMKCDYTKCCKYDQASCGSWASSNKTPQCNKGQYNISTQKCEYTANSR